MALLSTYYEGYIWKEFSKSVATDMSNSDNSKSYGYLQNIGFYRDTPFSPEDMKKYIDKMTKNNDVELIILNGKLIYDRKQFKELSDGQKIRKKQELIDLGKQYKRRY